MLNIRTSYYEYNGLWFCHIKLHCGYNEIGRSVSFGESKEDAYKEAYKMLKANTRSQDKKHLQILINKNIDEMKELELTFNSSLCNKMFQLLKSKKIFIKLLKEKELYVMTLWIPKSTSDLTTCCFAKTKDKAFLSCIHNIFNENPYILEHKSCIYSFSVAYNRNHKCFSRSKNFNEQVKMLKDENELFLQTNSRDNCIVNLPFLNQISTSEMLYIIDCIIKEKNIEMVFPQCFRPEISKFKMLNTYYRSKQYTDEEIITIMNFYNIDFTFEDIKNRQNENYLLLNIFINPALKMGKELEKWNKG